MDEAAAGFGTMWATMASWLTPTILFCVLNLVIGTILVASRFNTGSHQRPDGNEPHPRPQLGRAPSLLERLASINLSLHNSDPPETVQPNCGGGEHPPSQLARPPSFLERLRSVNLSLYNSDPAETLQPNSGSERHPPPQLARGPYFLERLRSVNLSLYNSDPPETLQPNSGGEHHPPPQVARPPSFLEQLRSLNLSFKNSDPPETLRPADLGAETNPPLADHQVTRSHAETTLKEAASPAKTSKSASDKPRADAVEARQPATASVEDEGVDARADDFINRFKQQLKLQRLDSFLRYRDMLNRGAGR